MDRWDEAYYGTMGTPMHPMRRKFLEENGLWGVCVATLIRFHDLPRARRMRTRIYWDTYKEAMDRLTWTNSSPVVACTIDPIGCRFCLSSREALEAAGDDMWCPRRTGLPSRQHCFWSRPAHNRDEDLCEDCQREVEEGCGFGDHDCQICIKDNHGFGEVMLPCVNCGPCTAIHDDIDDGDAWHCRMACPYFTEIVG
jgi:hypothetical protein